MKIVRFAAMLALLLAVGPAITFSQPGSVDPAACAVSSWSPEMFSFYGDKATVIAKFNQLDRDLLKHRTWAFVVESNRGAKLTFFELEKGNRTMDLGSTTGASFADLSNQITTTLLTNNGDKCAGMLTKELVANYTNGQMAHTAIPRPSTVGEAFQYAMAQTEGEYIRATFILLC
jgi:hypothetical protein